MTTHTTITTPPITSDKNFHSTKHSLTSTLRSDQHTKDMFHDTPPGWAQLHGGCTCWGHAVYSNYLLGLCSWARTEPYQFAQLIRILQRRETGHELGEDRQRWRVQWVILVLTLHVCAQERKSRCSPLYVSMTLALGCEHVNTHQFLRWG